MIRFYYDFFFPEKKLSDSDLNAIKKEMDKIIKADLPIRREEVTREEARLVLSDMIGIRYCDLIDMRYNHSQNAHSSSQRAL